MPLVIVGPMIQSFKSPGTEDVFNGVASSSARKCCPQTVWPIAWRKLDQLNRVRDLAELQVPPGNRLEWLKGNLKGLCSIRINQQYRICFLWENGHAYEVEIIDYH